jgi:hypothetical protein
MKTTFTVWLKTTDYYEMKIEAESAGEAMAIAEESSEAWGEPYNSEVDAWDAEAR